MNKIFLTICAVALVFTTHSAEAASLAPTLVDLQASRGEVVDQVVRVINTEAAEQVYYLGTLKFQSSGDGATPMFIAYDKDHRGLPEWISFPVNEIHVPARSSVDVPFKIAVPNDAASGSYYGAVTISSAPSDVVASNGAIIEAKTAELILLTVKGETRVNAALLDFTSDQFATADSSGFAIQSSFDGRYTYRVQNQGNVHVQPTGFLEFRDVFGRVIFSVDANPQAGRILPGTTRTFDVTIQDSHPAFAVGPIHAILTLNYADGLTLTAANRFWFVTWQPMVVAGVVLLILVWLAARGFKRS